VEPSGEEYSQPSENMVGEEKHQMFNTSHVESADMLEEFFTRVMQEKFLPRMVNDAVVDDDSMPEITRDPKEEYFKED